MPGGYIKSLASQAVCIYSILLGRKDALAAWLAETKFPYSACQTHCNRLEGPAISGPFVAADDRFWSVSDNICLMHDASRQHTCNVVLIK